MTLEKAKAMHNTLQKISVSGKENLRDLLACIIATEEEIIELQEGGAADGNHDDVQRKDGA